MRPRSANQIRKDRQRCELSTSKRCRCTCKGKHHGIETEAHAVDDIDEAKGLEIKQPKEWDKFVPY